MTCRRVGLPGAALKDVRAGRGGSRVPALSSRVTLALRRKSSQTTPAHRQPTIPIAVKRGILSFTRISKALLRRHGTAGEAHAHLAVGRGGRGEFRLCQGEAEAAAKVQGPAGIDIREIRKHARVNERRDRHEDQQSGGG